MILTFFFPNAAEANWNPSYRGAAGKRDALLVLCPSAVARLWPGSFICGCRSDTLRRVH